LWNLVPSGEEKTQERRIQGSKIAYVLEEASIRFPRKKVKTLGTPFLLKENV